MSFPQFAFNNVRRGARTYMAFFLSSAFMVMIFFSYSVFMYHPGVTSIEMGENSAAGMMIASYIVFIFAFFFVMYSISAFLKLRNQEFGILMILGARPGQINRLIMLENMLIGLLSIVTGMAAGMLLSKLFLLLSTKAIGIDNLPFYWPVKALVTTSVAFIALFLANSVFTLLFIRKNQVLELLKGSVKPKKEPKVSWLLSILGLALLTAGACFIWTPLSPLSLLSAAVTGIPGTYFFYSQLSVLGMRLLKISRKRVWRGTNLLWISEMSYKIKDNARMLFLVTVVTSLACMAAGFLLSVSQSNRTGYMNSPFGIIYTIYDRGAAAADTGRQKILSTLEQNGIKYTENKVNFIRSSIKDQRDKFKSVMLLPLSRFNQLAGQIESNALPALTDGEAVLVLNPRYRDVKFDSGQTVSLPAPNEQKLALKQVQTPKAMPFGQYTAPVLIVSDGYYEQAAAAADRSNLMEYYLYNIPDWGDAPPKAGEPKTLISSELETWSRNWNSANDNWDTLISTSAGDYMASKQGTSMLSFIGIFIALIFSLSSASFLYFKLHTELNADMKMYHSLSKIGLSVREMSAAATRQIALLFYIPILVAAVQTLVVIRPVLYQISIRNVTMPVLVTAAAFLAVQTVYFIIVRSRYIHSLKKMMV
ncbi:FtsX-like permease family protein [Paenibacillus riograndensis]|uniref:Efflux ABC transporter, permease protein n=1 Tax=Paenibacillus riograndensis SBR5 TaxID=1073571 RepID=A0A0E4CV32_9BACL|nr:ABC transporter permease [Paenibacillus riograndensis]CQR53334.1 efflux ABC transporter, permease protein [Paenibacillus riograndensis SBR5]